MTKIVCKENVAQQMTELLMQFVDIASMFPSEKPDAYVWERVLIFAPQQRKWVGLTDDEIESLDCVYLNWLDYEEVEIKGEKEFARAIEAKLKEKNA